MRQAQTYLLGRLDALFERFARREVRVAARRNGDHFVAAGVLALASFTTAGGEGTESGDGYLLAFFVEFRSDDAVTFARVEESGEDFECLLLAESALLSQCLRHFLLGHLALQ